MIAGYDGWLLCLLIVAGIGAGFINTVAGGGSLRTLPALMLLGLPANMANASNRLCIVAQSMSGAYGFYREGKLEPRSVGPILLPTAAGAGLGSLLASRAPNEILRPVLLGTLVLVALLMAFVPRALADDHEQRQPVGARAAMGLFAAGLYGGFIQAGVGFVLLSVIGGVLRYDLVRANALKLACTIVFGVVALAIFVAAGQVVWFPAAVLAAATVVGSQLGVRFALKADGRTIRRIVLVCVVLSVVAIVLRG